MGWPLPDGFSAVSVRWLSVLFLVVFCVAVLPNTGFAEDPTPAATASDDVPRPNFFSIITNLPSDYRDWFFDTFTRENIPSLLALTGLTGMLVMTDYETWQVVKYPYDNNETFHNVIEFGETWSGGNFQYGAAAAFLTAGIFGSHRALRTAYQIGEGILSSGIIVQILKHTTGRQSPFKATSRTGRWRVPPSYNDYSHNTQEFDAMPSGHLQSIAVTMFVIMENYPGQHWIPWVVYPSLGFFATSLVGSGIHWWSDMPIALALSYSFAKVITRRNDIKKTDGPPKVSYWPQFFPSVSDEGAPVVSANWVF
jgi:hypothetical protein